MRPNLWNVIVTFTKFEAETKRMMFSNAQGRDLTNNTGRKSQVEAKVRSLQALTKSYYNLPANDYLTLMAHCLASA